MVQWKVQIFMFADDDISQEEIVQARSVFKIIMKFNDLETVTSSRGPIIDSPRDENLIKPDCKSRSYLLWLQELLVRLVLLQLGIKSSVVLVKLLVLLRFQRVRIIGKICVQVVPFVDGNNHKVSITFIRYVNRNELIPELIVEIIHRCDLRIIRRRVLRRFVVGIKNVDGVFACSRWRWKLIARKTTRHETRESQRRNWIRDESVYV